MGTKGVDAVRLYVDKKEVPVLKAALEAYITSYPQEAQTVQKLLNKIDDCLELQVSQKPKFEH